MPKLPENFAAEEQVTHPYRPLVTIVAVIIVCSLVGGGLFYHYLRTNNAPDIFDWNGEKILISSSSVPMSDSERAKLSVMATAPLGSQSSTPQKQLDLLKRLQTARK